MGREHEVEDRLDGSLDAILAAVRSLIATLSQGDSAEFAKYYEANIRELRDRMLATKAEETYFEGLDHASAYIGNAIRRIPPSSGYEEG